MDSKWDCHSSTQSFARGSKDALKTVALMLIASFFMGLSRIDDATILYFGGGKGV